MPSQDSIRVLIVEDSSYMAQHLCELIAGVDHRIQILTVNSEPEAIDRVLADPPHLMVLDLHLKEGSGFGVLKKLRSIQPKPIIAVLTNFALPQYRDFAILSGADYFLDKAMTMEELPGVVKSLLRLH